MDYLSESFLGPVGSKESDWHVNEENCSPSENWCSNQQPAESIAYDCSRVDGDLVDPYPLAKTLTGERVCYDGDTVDEEKGGSHPLDKTEDEEGPSCWGEGA